MIDQYIIVITITCQSI